MECVMGIARRRHQVDATPLPPPEAEARASLRYLSFSLPLHANIWVMEEKKVMDVTSRVIGLLNDDHNGWKPPTRKPY